MNNWICPSVHTCGECCDPCAAYFWGLSQTQQPTTTAITSFHLLLLKNSMWGCRHSSVDSSAPTILPPQVRVPSTPSMLYHLWYLCYICHLKRTKINKKRPGLAHFFKKVRWIKNSLASCAKGIFPTFNLLFFHGSTSASFNQTVQILE